VIKWRTLCAIFFCFSLPCFYCVTVFPLSSVFTSALASRFCADTTLSVVTLPLLFAEWPPDNPHVGITLFYQRPVTTTLLYGARQPPGTR
jgi:hypothetical protein